jgi:hypothetical protein
MEQINFQNQFFPLRELEISKANSVFISTTKLNSLLMTDSGAYVSGEAELIDDSIYYYVESSQISLSKRKLIQLILSETNA